jgi:MYXO-CTERM domain-containing protein
MRVAALAVLTVLVAARPALAGCPVMTRDQIIALAKTGVGCPYVWGGTCWDPANTSWKGADCSGFVTKCWQVPAASKTTDCLPHYYTTDSFYSDTTYWNPITRADLLPGDALVYRSGSSGHIVLFEAFTDTSGCYQVYEARGTSYGIVHRVKCPDSTYQPRRRQSLSSSTTPPVNQPPQGKLEVADCSSITGWAYDPDAKTTSISVHVYFDAAPGQAGAVGYGAPASQSRPDLQATLGSSLHGFALTVPSRFKDGVAHAVYAYGVDSAGGLDDQLEGSPKSIRCAPAGGDSGPDPVALDAGVYPDSGTPPNLELPDSPENELTLTGSCACRSGGPGGAIWAALALAAGLLLALRRTRRRG